MMMKRYREEAAEEVDNIINLADVLILLSKGENDIIDQTSSPGRVFECKTCNRRFPSFQALGGHRASHKKPKALGFDDRREIPVMPVKPKVHECSICGLEFAIGQALGGHMRRHRAAAAGGFGDGFVEKKCSSSGKRVQLDLNLPPLELEEDLEGTKLGLGLGIGMGFVDRSAMLDCFH